MPAAAGERPARVELRIEKPYASLYLCPFFFNQILDALRDTKALFYIKRLLL